MFDKLSTLTGLSVANLMRTDTASNEPNPQFGLRAFPQFVSRSCLVRIASCHRVIAFLKRVEYIHVSQESVDSFSLPEMATEAIEGVEVGTVVDDSFSVEEASDVNEEEALNMFREEISSLVGLQLDDYFGHETMLKRWIRARSMNVDEAVKMFKESHEWKQTAGIYSILEWKPPAEFIDDFPFHICGLDNEGDPFGVVTWKKWNVDALLAALSRDGGETHLKYFYQCLEIIHRIHKDHSNPPHKIVRQGIVVVDMEGLAVTQFASKEAVSVLLEGTRKFEANYPGLLKKVVVVNAPTIFSLLWQIISPLLSEETKSKVEVHGYYSYNDDWKSNLRQLVPVDYLPSHYGGADTNCKSYKPHHGFRNFQNAHVSLEKFKLKPATVAAGDKHKICVKVTKPKSVLRWEFKSDDYDVGFCVTHEDEEKEVVSYSRADSHVLLQKGALECQKPGKYNLVFDNSFSRWRAKSVFYRTVLVEPITATSGASTAEHIETGVAHLEVSATEVTA